MSFPAIKIRFVHVPKSEDAVSTALTPLKFKQHLLCDQERKDMSKATLAAEQ